MGDAFRDGWVSGNDYFPHPQVRVLGRRWPTCLKQKGMVSTLTPTMLFTTFMIRPQLDAVILSPLVDRKPPSVRICQKTRRQQLIEGARCRMAVCLLRGGGDWGLYSGCVFLTPPPITDVALWEKNKRQLSLMFDSLEAFVILSNTP